MTETRCPVCGWPMPSCGECHNCMTGGPTLTEPDELCDYTISDVACGDAAWITDYCAAVDPDDQPDGDERLTGAA